MTEFNILDFKKYCENELQGRTFLIAGGEISLLFDAVRVFISPNAVCFSHTGTPECFCVDGVVSADVGDMIYDGTPAVGIKIHTEEYIRSSYDIIAY